MHTLKVLLSLNPGPQKLLLEMIEARDVDTNQVSRKALKDKRLLQNHVSALMRVDLVRRMQAGMYMINPLAVMPPNGNAARATWSILLKETEEDTATTPVKG